MDSPVFDLSEFVDDSGDNFHDDSVDNRWRTERREELNDESIPSEGNELEYKDRREFKHSSAFNPKNSRKRTRYEFKSNSIDGPTNTSKSTPEIKNNSSCSNNDGVIAGIRVTSGISSPVYSSVSPPVEIADINNDAIFSCELDSSDVLTNLLESLSFDRYSPSSLHNTNTPFICLRLCLMPAGMKLLVEKSRIMCAKAYVKSNLFSTYSLSAKHQNITFNLSLRHLLHCLRSIGPNAHFSMRVYSCNDPIEIVLEENGMIVEVKLAVLENSERIFAYDQNDVDNDIDSSVVNHITDQVVMESEEFDFRRAPVVAKCVIKSDLLRPVFNELDQICKGYNSSNSTGYQNSGSSNHYFSLRLQSVFPRLTSAVCTPQLSASFSIQPSTNGDAFSEFTIQPTDNVYHYLYPISLVKPTLTVLSYADHTNLRINSVGMLSLQHVVRTRIEGVNNWVEVICKSIETEQEIYTNNNIYLNEEEETEEQNDR